MSVSYTEWDVQLINARTKSPVDDDSGLCNVLTASDPTELTIYSDAKGTSASNPITMTNGIIRFFTDASTTTVDLSILTSGGHSVFIQTLTPSQHRIEIDMDKSYENYLIVPYHMNTACDAIVDTGFDLIAGMMVKDCFVHTTTASTANGLYIGVSGTTAGFLSVVSTTATGWKVHDNPIITNATGSANYVSGTQIKGTLLSVWEAGISTACAGGAEGLWINKKYTVTAATSIIYMVVATNSGGTGEGYIYFQYDLLPTVGN